MHVLTRTWSPQTPCIISWFKITHSFFFFAKDYLLIKPNTKEAPVLPLHLITCNYMYMYVKTFPLSLDLGCVC